MGKTFQKIHASLAGKLQHGDKIAQWVRSNGGEFHKEVTSKVTHLIASTEAYKANVEAVQTAKDLGKIKIVSYDWLEDSLLSKTRRPKGEGPYLLENLLKAETKNERKRKRIEEQKPSKKRMTDPFAYKKTTKGGKAAAPPKNHIYMDPATGETWNATLIRPCQPPRRREKYHLAVFETTKPPYTYSAYIKRTQPGKSEVERLVGPKSDLCLAKSAFKRFFTVQTGKEWEDRMDGRIPPPKSDTDGKILPPHEGWFSFEKTISIFTEYIMQAEQSIDPNQVSSAPAETEDATSDSCTGSIHPDNEAIQRKGTGDVDGRQTN